MINDIIHIFCFKEQVNFSGFLGLNVPVPAVPGQCLIRQVMDPKGYLTDLNALQVPWVPVGPRDGGLVGAWCGPGGPGWWWLEPWEFWMTFQKQLGMENHPNWLSVICPSFFRGVGSTVGIPTTKQAIYMWYHVVSCGSARWRNQVQSDADISDIKKARLLRISSAAGGNIMGIYWDGLQPMKVILPKVSSTH